MKNKIIKRIFTAVFAVLLLMGCFSIPAYANGGGEATNDSNVKTEETKEEKKPLTPDGNMSLVDNVKGDAAKETAKAVFEAYFAETLQKEAKNAETTVTEGTE